MPACAGRTETTLRTILQLLNSTLITQKKAPPAETPYLLSVSPPPGGLHQPPFELLYLPGHQLRLLVGVLQQALLLLDFLGATR